MAESLKVYEIEEFGDGYCVPVPMGFDDTKLIELDDPKFGLPKDFLGFETPDEVVEFMEKFYPDWLESNEDHYSKSARQLVGKHFYDGVTPPRTPEGETLSKEDRLKYEYLMRFTNVVAEINDILKAYEGDWKKMPENITLYIGGDIDNPVTMSKNDASDYLQDRSSNTDYKEELKRIQTTPFLEKLLEEGKAVRGLKLSESNPK